MMGLWDREAMALAITIKVFQNLDRIGCKRVLDYLYARYYPANWGNPTPGAESDRL